MDAYSHREPGSMKAPGPLGLYLIVAYCAFKLVQFPFQLPAPEQLYLGPVVLQGHTVVVLLSLTAAVLVVMTVGLVFRRSWARTLGLVVFAAGSVVILASAVRWLGNWDPIQETYRTHAGRVTARDALRIMILPLLWSLVPSVLAFIYLLKRRDLFRPHEVSDVVVA